MREYTAKEMKKLKENPYTFKVTKNKLYFTADFKKAFWTAYQTGVSPRKLITDMGYDMELFGQKQIDSIVQRIKQQAQTGYFTEGENRERRAAPPIDQEMSLPEPVERIWNEVKYLRQEVEFLKKIIKEGNSQKVVRP
jgi:hypothetical protein